MFKKTLLALSLSFGLASVAHAGIVTNETTLLSGAGHQQLSTWLGQDVNLTRIFAKGVDGNAATDWHSHVDGQGATFTIMELFNGQDRRVIGGYSQYDWQGNGYINDVNDDNFLFNLTDGLLFQKNTNSTRQTYRANVYGTIFGGGHDLLVNSTLSGGYANIGDSYGDYGQYGQNTYREAFTGSYNSWTIGDYETFTLSSSTGDFGSGAASLIDEQGNAIGASDVSVPVGLGALALAGMFGLRRKRS